MLPVIGQQHRRPDGKTNGQHRKQQRAGGSLFSASLRPSQDLKGLAEGVSRF